MRLVMSLFFAAALLTAPVVHAAQGLVDWQPANFEAAKARAQQEGKLIYIFVEGSNCPPCDSFKFSHLNDPVFADFVNTLFVPIRCHEGVPEDRAFLDSLRLNHAAVPRFYVLSADGRGISYSIGMVSAPPMGPADTLRMATGRELPVDRNAAAQLAQRIRAYADGQRRSGALYPDSSMRHIGVAILEAWAWALAGRIDEAERAWGGQWANQLGDQEVRYMYVIFWSKWHRNAQGALAAAQDYQRAAPGDPAGEYLMGMALAANGRFEEALRIGDGLIQTNPGNTAIEQEVDSWRAMAGRTRGALLPR